MVLILQYRIYHWSCTESVPVFYTSQPFCKIKCIYFFDISSHSILMHRWGPAYKLTALVAQGDHFFLSNKVQLQPLLLKYFILFNIFLNYDTYIIWDSVLQSKGAFTLCLQCTFDLRIGKAPDIYVQLIYRPPFTRQRPTK